MRKFCICIVLIFVSLHIRAQEVSLIRGLGIKQFPSPFVSYFEDPEGQLTIQNIQTEEIQRQFSTIDPQSEENIDSYFWIKIKVKNISPEPYLLSTNYYTRNISFYYPDYHGNYNQDLGGLHTFITDKRLHVSRDQFILNTSIEATTYYLRLQRIENKKIYIQCQPASMYINTSLKEELLLGVLIGIVFIISFYSFAIYSRLRTNYYLYFGLYMISFGLFVGFDQNLCTKYIWFLQPNHTILFQLYSIPFTLSTIFLILFTKSLLFENQGNNRAKVIFNIAIVARCAIWLLGNIQYKFFTEPAFDAILLLPCLAAGIYFGAKGDKTARYFVIAFVFIFIGLSIKSFTMMEIWTLNDIFVGDWYFGLTLFGIALFSFSAAEKIKMTQQEKEETQTRLIYQLKEKELLKDKMNQELEDKVKNRTAMIEEKNRQLDTFVYKASHDIRGPLRSIVGLSSLGLMDDEIPKLKNYFTLIQRSTEKLDKTIEDLLDIVKINHEEKKFELIDFKVMVDEIISSLEHAPNFDMHSILKEIQPGLQFYSDRLLLHSILQNLIENSFNYRDQKKESHYTRITVSGDPSEVILKIEDNGIGISKPFQDKIFDMFYKINADSMGTGLGLYIVKLSLDKIGGHIHIESEEGKGTIFTVTLKKE